MGIFYHPPPPAGRAAVTPPEPHVPIGTQGSQPPRFTTAVMLAVVLASWPADLEPRLARPNDQPQKIAPLTLTYGSQPPRFSLASRMAQAGLAWPADLEPRLTRPNDLRQTIAPLTLTYGSRPPLNPPLSVVELTKIAAAWAQTWDAQTGPKNASWNVPPVVAFVPHTSPPAWLWTAWDPPFIRPQTLVSVAPLTLPSGAQPSPQPALSITELAQIVGTWQQAWDAQTAPRSTAWNVQLVPFLPHTGPPALIWSAWEPPFVSPPRPVTLAPLTLPSGSPPTPQSPVSVLELAQLLGTWAQTWDAQTAGKTAGWMVPPIVVPTVAYTPPPALIWAAWTETILTPPTLVLVAPLTASEPVVEPPVEPVVERSHGGGLLYQSRWPTLPKRVRVRPKGGTVVCTVGQAVATGGVVADRAAHARPSGVTLAAQVGSPIAAGVENLADAELLALLLAADARSLE